MNRVCSLLLIIIISALTVLPCRAQTQETKTAGLTDAKELEAFLDPIFAERMEKLHIPGAAIAIVKDGKIFFAKGYGYANLERKTPVIADKTIFRIGSITKVFTATTLAQMAQKITQQLKLAENNSFLDFSRFPGVQIIGN